jgi:hypothetical protein
MNLRGLVVPLALGAIAAGLFVAALALFGGCGHAVVLEEPPFTMTVARARDAG